MFNVFLIDNGFVGFEMFTPPFYVNEVTRFRAPEFTVLRTSSSRGQERFRRC